MVNASCMNVFLPRTANAVFGCPRFIASPILLQSTCWRAFAGAVETQPGPGIGQSQGPRLPREETLAALGPGNRVDIAGLAANLPNGRYTYDLRPIDPAYPRQFHVVLEKNAATITLPLPSPGLYDLTISDQLNTQRIDVFIAAVRPDSQPDVMKSYQDATALIRRLEQQLPGLADS